MSSIMRLKSGTDIRGVAIEGVLGEKIDLTDEVLIKISNAFSIWLSRKKNKNFKELSVAIGHDTRLSFERIKNVIIGTLSQLGIRILDCGLASTPAMFMTTIDLNCDAAIEITASHHPFNRNGLKFFTKDGGLDGCEIEEILVEAENKFSLCKTEKVFIEKLNYMQDYAKRLRRVICEGLNENEENKPLEGFKIIVDAGNGVGGFYATDVLKVLGADISGSQFLEPDGRFTNHIPNPEDKMVVKSAVEATIKNKADLGIIFDTDVDRVSAVDNKGNEICRNKLIALASKIALKDNIGGTIVTDSLTSDGLSDYIKNELGGVHNRFKRGYKNVINEARRLNSQGINCPLAIETSGHAAMRENYFLDDGAYLATKIIIEMVNLRRKGKSFEDVLSRLKSPQESMEFRLKILCENFKIYGEKIISDLYTYVREENYGSIVPDNKEGIRISFDKNNGDGWLLLRLSLHDPVMPLNVESNAVNGVNLILSKFKNFIVRYNKLDISLMEPFIGK